MFLFQVSGLRCSSASFRTHGLSYSPYTGDLSLELVRASKGARGGILADEMGLGKTSECGAWPTSCRVSS